MNGATRTTSIESTSSATTATTKTLHAPTCTDTDISTVSDYGRIEWSAELGSAVEKFGQLGQGAYLPKLDTSLLETTLHQRQQAPKICPSS